MRGKPAEIGERRTRSFFAFLPVHPQEEDEWRWLEWVTVEQEYQTLGQFEWPGWVPIRFID